MTGRISIFLDEFDAYAHLTTPDSCSKRNRVFEEDAMVFTYDGRASRQDASCVYYISDELHQWFMDQNPKYHFPDGAVQLDLAIKTNHKSFMGEVGGFMLTFRDPDLAVLFKLAWGGTDAAI